MAAFLLLVAANAALSYLPGPPWVRISLGVPALLLGLWLLARSLRAPVRSPLECEFLPRFPFTVLIFLGLTFLLLRFYRFDSLFIWPNGDESQNAYFARRLNEDWEWKLFYGFGEAPSMLIWLVALAFRVLKEPLAAVWLPPTLLSALTVAVSYPAARQFSGRSFSLMVACLFGVGYWPLYMGRVCHQGMALPLLACLTLLALGKYMRASTGGSRKSWAVCGGLLGGAGSLVFTPWPAVTVLSAVAFARTSRGRRVDRLLYAGALAFALIPFALAVLNEGWGWHMRDVVPWSRWLPWNEVALASLSYVTGLYWGPVVPHAAYGAWHGGLLDPVVGALSLAGWVVLWRLRDDPRVRGILWAFPILLAPGLLSMNVEYFRIAQVLPILLATAAAGAGSLLSSVRSSRVRLGAAVILFLSTGAWDASRIMGPPLAFPGDAQLFTRDARNAESYGAFRSLEAVEREKGPGWVLDLSITRIGDPSLEACTYPFNAAVNPRLDPESASWAALLVGKEKVPFLKARLKGVGWVRPGEGLPGGGDLWLGLLPLTPENKALLERWRKACVHLQEVNREYLYLAGGEPPEIVFDTLREHHGDFQGDRFLESVFWEKQGEYRYLLTRDLDEHIGDLDQALQRGLPLPHIQYKLGVLLLRKGDLEEARKMLLMALAGGWDEEEVRQALEKVRERMGAGK